jgi:hypothetical protein
LGFVAGALLVGIPVSLVVTHYFLDSATVWVVVPLGSGLLGAIYGDAFFGWVADSDWWAALRGVFRRWWL